MTPLKTNVISVEEARTLDGLFARRVDRSAQNPAYRYFSRREKDWRSHTWRDMAAAVAAWQQAMLGEQLSPGDRVAILLRNCPEWVMFDQAALSLGLVTVPLYTDDRPENVAYILEESGAKLLVIQDAGRWKRLDQAVPGDGALRCVVLVEDGEDAAELLGSDQRVRVASAWLPPGPNEFRTRTEPDPHDLASIVYTSGTTGRPKGVMLSHHNMLSVAHASLNIIDCYEQDVFLSFLPLSHTLERTGGYYLPMIAGAMVGYARSVPQLAEDLKVIRPTVLVAVPRIFERVYGRIRDQMRKKSAFARRLFGLAIDVGWTRFLHQQGRAGWSPRLILWPLLERLVGRKVSAGLGGRVRIAVSGGAPLAPDIARVFIGMGVPIVQGYGLTETSPVISVNPLQDNIPDSVGVPIAGTQVKIGADDELLVKGPGVMQGYWNNPDATAKIIDADGWLHTGDQARLDASNHIYITGRIKDVLVLSNGEKVPPADMEMAIVMDGLFEQVMVVGEGRPYLTALAVLSAEQWPALAQELGLDPQDRNSLQDERIHHAVLRRIREALRGFPGYAKIRQVRLSLEPWSIDDGLITPTLKVKRPKVLEKFAEEVQAMYAHGPAG